MSCYSPMIVSITPYARACLASKNRSTSQSFLTSFNGRPLAFANALAPLLLVYALLLMPTALFFLLFALLAAEAVLDALEDATFVSIFAFSFFSLALVEDLVELFFVDLVAAGASALGDPLLEAVDVLHVPFLLLVLLGLLVCLNGLMELLVLKLLLLLLE